MLEIMKNIAEKILPQKPVLDITDRDVDFILAAMQSQAYMYTDGHRRQILEADAGLPKTEKFQIMIKEKTRSANKTTISIEFDPFCSIKDGGMTMVSSDIIIMAAMTPNIKGFFVFDYPTRIDHGRFEVEIEKVKITNREE